MHWLWYHLDLSIAKRRVSPKHVLRLIARSKSSIKKATLHNVVVAELQLFSDALLTCRKLKEISLNYVPPASLYINPRQPLLRDTRALRIEFESQVNQFKKIAEGCPQLEDVKISFSDCPSSASFTMPYLPRLRSLHCVVHNDVSRLVFHMLVCHLRLSCSWALYTDFSPVQGRQLRAKTIRHQLRRDSFPECGVTRADRFQQLQSTASPVPCEMLNLAITKFT